MKGMVDFTIAIIIFYTYSSAICRIMRKQVIFLIGKAQAPESNLQLFGYFSDKTWPLADGFITGQ